MAIVADRSGNTANNDAHIATPNEAADAATAAALALKAPLASPTFTGVPAVPTAAPGTSTTQTASTAFATTANALKVNKTDAWQVLAKSSGPVVLTGTTTQTDMVVIPLPAGTMGPNGQVRVEALISVNNNANNKIHYLKFGATTYQANNLVSNAAYSYVRRISNQNSVSAQVSFINSTSTYATSSTANTTSVIDTSVNQNITFIGTLSNAGDNLTIESYIIEYIYGA